MQTLLNKLSKKLEEKAFYEKERNCQKIQWKKLYMHKTGHQVKDCINKKTLKRKDYLSQYHYGW